MAKPPVRQLDESTALEVGGQLCELSAHIQAAQAELALRLADLDDAAGWGGAGIRSCCHWLSIQAGLDYHTSSDLLRVGHGLAELPLIRQAFSSGQLSLDKVRALLRVATPADEEIWLELALGADAALLARICREVRRSMDADAPGQVAELEAKRGLWTRATWRTSTRTPPTTLVREPALELAVPDGPRVTAARANYGERSQAGRRCRRASRRSPVT